VFVLGRKHTPGIIRGIRVPQSLDALVTSSLLDDNGNTPPISYCYLYIIQKGLKCLQTHTKKNSIPTGLRNPETIWESLEGVGDKELESIISVINMERSRRRSLKNNVVR